MIGKMYRPLKVYTLLGKRDGFRFRNKYKSNFIGLNEFDMDVHLVTHTPGMREVVRIELEELVIPVAVAEDKFVKVSDKETKSTKDPMTVNRLRKFERPVNKQISSSGSELAIQIPIISKDPSENDFLTLTLRPIVHDNEEFLWIEAEAKTQIEIVANTSVTYIKR